MQRSMVIGRRFIAIKYAIDPAICQFAHNTFLRQNGSNRKVLQENWHHSIVLLVREWSTGEKPRRYRRSPDLIEARTTGLDQRRQGEAIQTKPQT